MAQEAFWFRDDDGGETAASGLGFWDTSANASVSYDIKTMHATYFRLRFAIRAQQAPGVLTPLLEFKETDFLDPDCSESGWQAVGTTGRFVLRDSSNFVNGASTTQQISGGSSFAAGSMADIQNPAPSAVVAQNARTEYEWSLEDTSEFIWERAFAFRVTNNGAPFNLYNSCAVIIFPREPQISVSPTVVAFSGDAYPGAKITVVDKYARAEIPIRQDPVTAESGKFSIKFIGVFQGDHSYGLIIEDKDGRRTQTKFFNIDTVSNSLTQKDIFTPPTVDLYRASVTKGDFIKVIGYAAPGNKVMVQLDNSAINYEVAASSSGYYHMLVNTARLPFGTHAVRAKQQDKDGKRESDWSGTKSILVAQTTVPEADFNGDGMIDIRDWSVFLSRWNEKSDARKVLDLNHNGKVDISDASIFLQSLKMKK